MLETTAPYNTVTEPYSAEHYNAIPNSLRQACKNYEDGQQLVNTKVCEIFIRHGVEDLFTACLVHRHYDIAPNERNVASDGDAVAIADLDDAYPSSWMFVNGKLYPYEYSRGEKTPCPPKQFVAELGKLITESGYQDLIGFQVYDYGYVGDESNDRVTNVSTTIRYPEAEYVTKEGMSAASWAFERLPSDQVPISV